jgi:hypothetical protein
MFLKKELDRSQFARDESCPISVTTFQDSSSFESSSASDGQYSSSGLLAESRRNSLSCSLTQTFPLEKLPILEDWNLYTELEKELGEAKLHLSKHFPCESTNLGEVWSTCRIKEELAVMLSFFFAKKFFFSVFYRTFIW